MAKMTGETGRVVWSGYSGCVDNAFAWTLNEAVGTVADTSFRPSGGYSTFLPGLISATGTVSCYMDDTTLPPQPNRTTTSMVLVAKSGVEFACQAFITSAAMGSRVDGVATLDLGFQVTGPITRTTSGTN